MPWLLSQLENGKQIKKVSKENTQHLLVAANNWMLNSSWKGIERREHMLSCEGGADNKYMLSTSPLYA